MAKTDDIDFALPSDPKARQKIKDAIYEISGTMQQIADKREYIKDSKKMLKDEFGIPPKISGKMAKTVFNHDYQNVIQENSTFESAYDILFNGGASDESEESDE